MKFDEAMVKYNNDVITLIQVENNARYFRLSRILYEKKTKIIDVSCNSILFFKWGSRSVGVLKIGPYLTTSWSILAKQLSEDSPHINEISRIP